MTAFQKYLFLLPVVAMLALAACSDDDTTTPNNPPPGDTRAELAGNILGTRTLNPDSVYVLKGFVQVQPGAELIIPAGTRIEGDYATKGALITVRGSGGQPSGKITAIGTAANPIVFTSSQAVGSRKRGDWGGIVLNGLAPNNFPGGTGIGEGNSGAHGGAKAEDNSGSFKYVRIEFGGTKITPDNEINGFTFNSVGSGTMIDYVQCHFIADDGFEFFGGTVNVKHLVSSGNDDDGFDYDNGYSGRGQFLYAIQDPDLANRGTETDNNSAGNGDLTTTPDPAVASLSYDGTQTLTNPLIFNATYVGAAKETANNEKNDGLYYRRNSQARYYNTAIVNFGGYAVIADGGGVQGHVTDGSYFVKNSVLSSTKGAFANVSSGTYTAQTIPAEWNSSSADPMLTDIGFTTNDPRPKAGSPCLVDGNAANPTAHPKSNGFFDAANYIGAFDGTTNWTAGWTTFAKN